MKLKEYLNNLNIKWKPVIVIHRIGREQQDISEIFSIIKKEIFNNKDMPYIFIFENYEVTYHKPGILFEKEISDEEAIIISDLWDDEYDELDIIIDFNKDEYVDVFCFIFNIKEEDIIRI